MIHPTLALSEKGDFLLVGFAFSIIAGLVAAGFTSWLNNRSEAKRFERESEAELARWQRARDEERERWLRDQRSVAYQRLLAEGWRADEKTADDVALHDAIAAVEVFGSLDASVLALRLSNVGTLTRLRKAGNTTIDIGPQTFTDIYGDLVELVREELKHTD